MITTLEIYNRCKIHYEAVKPIRGTDIRPFAQRRRKHEHMKLLDNGDIRIYKHNTPVVIFHKDGGISVSHGGWETSTTSGFIGYVLSIIGLGANPKGAFKKDNKLWLWQINPSNHKNVFMPITEEPIKYNYDPHSNLYKPETNPVVQKKRIRINKVAKNDMMKECAAFMEWFNAFGKLLDGTPNDCPTKWVYDYRLALRYPSGVYNNSVSWWGHKSRTMLRDVATGTDEVKYMEFIQNVEDMSGRREFNFQKCKKSVMHLLYFLFDVYYPVMEDVSYAIDRETKW